MMLATDWTYDLFAEDAKLYNAKPMRGIYCPVSASDREKFMTWFKTEAKVYKDKWLEEHNGHLYDRYDGYVGDGFMRQLPDMCFSDYYKDVYNQRPHLPRWFYVHLVDLPTNEDTARSWCANPIGDACKQAKWYRECAESYVDYFD